MHTGGVILSRQMQFSSESAFCHPCSLVSMPCQLLSKLGKQSEKLYAASIKGLNMRVPSSGDQHESEETNDPFSICLMHDPPPWLAYPIK